MDFFGQIASKIDVFMLILARVGGIFLIGPVFSNRVIPGQVKALLTFVLSMILFTGLHLKTPVIPTKLGPYTLYLVSELIVGLIIGFVAQMTFAAIQFAGQSVDMQMGFGIVNVIDPVYGTQAPLVGSFQNLLALLLFLTTNSHHYMLAALFQSYEKIPIFGLTGGKEASQMMIDLFGNMLVTGLKLAIPVVGALFVAEMALGMISRTVPQMQVFFVAIPAKIILGFILLIVVLPVYIATLQYLFEGNYQDTLRLFKILG
ncbi:MAG: flagellar biosynthetic protein FliR [Eubacteriales bacterium]